MILSVIGKLIVANWKANKTLAEAVSWVEKVGARLIKLRKKIILCPSAVFILPLAEKISKLNFGDFFDLGTQDISKYPPGAYTGEISVQQLEGLVRFSIIGHSERRKYFGEKDDDVIKKVQLLIESQIDPILCISDLDQLDTYIEKGKIIENANKIVFVYEPPAAISGGGEYHPDTPESANENALKISQKIGNRVATLYGGSINLENVLEFFSQENIDGGLIGQASLDPDTFIRILEITR